MIKLFNMTFLTTGFALIAVKLIALTINSFKTPMIVGIVFSVVAKFSHFIL